MKAPHMMVLSEAFPWSSVSEGVMVHPSQAQRKVPAWAQCLPRRLPKLADTSTDTDRQMDRDGVLPLLCAQRHLEEVWLVSLLRLGHGGLECQGQETVIQLLALQLEAQ